MIVSQTGADCSSIKNKMPSLESLDTRSPDYAVDATDDFESMPMPARLSVMPVDAWVGAHTFPWTRLTAFDGNGHELTVHQSHNLLPRRPDLASLNVSLLREPTSSKSFTSPLRFVQLESLNLTAGGNGGLDCFLGLLSYSLYEPWLVPFVKQTVIVIIVG